MGNVSLVVVSHSRKLAEGVVQLASQMAGPSVHLAPCGGIGDELGTSAPAILETLLACPEDSPILVIFDIGSAFMNCEMALEMAPASVRDRTEIVDAPIVEGTVVAAVTASLGQSQSQVKAAAEDARCTAKVAR